MSKIRKIYIFALAAHGKGISGGDRIFIELARRWSKKILIDIFVWEEGYRMCLRQELKQLEITYHISDMRPWKYFGFFINYLARILEGIKIGLKLKIENNSTFVVYSASEFWMDSLACFLLKMRLPKIIWVASWFQTSPNPFKGFSEGSRVQTYKFNSLLYWLVQLPIKPLIEKWANFVLVNNDLEKKYFPKLDAKKRAIVVYGAVDLEKIEKFKKSHKMLVKIYDAVFQGRFHPQKGVLELIDIWKIVVDRNHLAKLVMIGDGPLMGKVKSKISKLRLENNIILKGFLFDGEEKYKIFAESKLVVHPSFYDSGGMAAAEAMEFGLPAVGFDLHSYKFYYPKGMIKVKLADSNAFASEIIKFINDQSYRNKIGQEAFAMIKKNWSWDERAEEILNKLN